MGNERKKKSGRRGKRGKKEEEKEMGSSHVFLDLAMENAVSAVNEAEDDGPKRQVDGKSNGAETTTTQARQNSFSFYGNKNLLRKGFGSVRR